MSVSRSSGSVSSLEPFLYSLHTTETMHEMQAAFVRSAGDLLRAPAYGVYQFTAGTAEPLLVRTRGVSDAYLARYESDGRVCDPLLRRVASELDTFCSDTDLTARRWRSCPLYEINAFGGIERAVQGPLVVGGELVGTINVARTAREPAFTRAEIDAVRVLARHISIAVARLQRLAELERRGTLLEATLDVLGMPLLVSGPEGQVVFANRAADRLLFDSRASSAAAFATGLQANLAELAGARRRVSTTFVPLGGDDVMARPLRPRRAQGARTGLTVRSVRLADVNATVSFVYETPSVVSAPLPLLSPREREIVDLVALGLSNAQIGSAASISPNTVKQHLKRVFQKLQVRTRAELAATAGRAGAEAAAPFAADVGATRPLDGAADGPASV